MRLPVVGCRGRKYTEGSPEHAVAPARAAQPHIDTLADGSRQVSCLYLSQKGVCVVSQTRLGVDGAICLHLRPASISEVLVDTEDVPLSFVDHKIGSHEISSRVFHCLENPNISGMRLNVPIGDGQLLKISNLIQCEPHQLLWIEHFGRVSLNEVRQYLAQRGLHLKGDEEALEQFSRPL